MKIFTLLLLYFCTLVPPPVSAAWETAGGTSDDHWVISDNAVLDNADADWTWAFMWNYVTTGSGDRYIFSNANTAGANPAFLMYCSSSSGPQNFSVRNNDDGTADQVAGSSAQECNTLDTWRRVVFQHTGNTITVYLDNVSVASDTTVAGLSSGPAGGLFFGTRPDLGGDSASQICDVAKWTRLLNSDERESISTDTGGKGRASVSMYPNSQTIYIPAVRDFIEIRSGLTVTNSGASVVDCPRLFRPS